MPLKFDARGAYRAGKRFKSMATKLGQAEELAASDLARRLVPEFVREATARYNLPAKRLRETSAARREGTVAVITGYDRPTGLLNFGAKASRTQGVSFVMKRASGPQRLKHAFIATGLSGNRHVFSRDLSEPKREMEFGRYKGKKRRPIQSHYGSSTAQILRDREVRDALRKFSQQRLVIDIRRHLGRL